MGDRDERSALSVQELVLETRRLVEANRQLQHRLRARRLWRATGLAMMLAGVFYAWSIHTLLSENISLLRANTELVQSGNALLRASTSRQQEMQTALKQMRRPLELSRPESPRRGLDGCPDASASCDSSTYWVPGFPGPRISTKRAGLRPST